MTELAAGYQPPRADSDDSHLDSDATGSIPAIVEPASDTQPQSTSDGESRFGGAVDRVGEVAGDVAERVGDVAGRVGDAAERAAERAAAATGRIASQVVDRLRNDAELAAERGTTRIADEVVEKIAGIATREVPGVYDLGGDVARFFASVKERVGLGSEGETADQGVSVQLAGKTAEVKLTIVVEYGFVVYSVTEKVRAKVISAIENLLGLEVTTVDILVDDVHVSDETLTGQKSA
jgi:uncharacterized alkaline shock family protein YloU